MELTTAEDWRWRDARGIDVYAFDGRLPEKLPQDGAVWLLNPPRSPREVGVVLGERLMGAYVKGARTDTELGERLTRGLVLGCGRRAVQGDDGAGRAENVLLCGEMPVMAAGTNANGCLQAVLPFDIQESNLPLLPDFVVLVNNMLEASAPTLLTRRRWIAERGFIRSRIRCAAGCFCRRRICGWKRSTPRGRQTAFAWTAPAAIRSCRRCAGSSRWCVLRRRCRRRRGRRRRSRSISRRR